jgi:hypothetical protein
MGSGRLQAALRGARAAALILGVRLVLAALPRRAVPALLAPRPGLRPADRETAERVRRAMDLAYRRVPGCRACLPRALAAAALLRAAGCSADLRIGVARTGSDALEAHAWVESGGIVVAGGPSVGAYAALPPLSRARP